MNEAASIPRSRAIAFSARMYFLYCPTAHSVRFSSPQSARGLNKLYGRAALAAGPRSLPRAAASLEAERRRRSNWTTPRFGSRSRRAAKKPAPDHDVLPAAGKQIDDDEVVRLVIETATYCLRDNAR
jgi:hypothetical protein